MTISKASTLFGLVFWFLISIVVYMFLSIDPRFNMSWEAPRFHFYVVSGASIIAAVCSIVIGWLGARLRNANVLLLSLGFMSLFGFFSIHGLSTPGFILEDEMYHLPGIATQLGLTLCSIWFFFSTLPSDNLVVRSVSKHSRLFIVCWITLLLFFCTLSLIYPDIAEWVPVDSSPIKFGMALITSALLLWTGKTYFQQYRFARFPLQIAVSYSVIWLTITQVIVVTSVMWTMTWWFYHVF
ncbi:MAG: metal dependent phosphohydrolase, partial [Bacilli bacterium]|nr:metal dependent phosphohydrolase [Bacilli bacterium]